MRRGRGVARGVGSGRTRDARMSCEWHGDGDGDGNGNGNGAAPRHVSVVIVCHEPTQWTEATSGSCSGEYEVYGTLPECCQRGGKCNYSTMQFSQRRMEACHVGERGGCREHTEAAVDNECSLDTLPAVPLSPGHGLGLGLGL